MTDEIERQVQELPRSFKKTKKTDKINVANVTLAYDNVEVIKMLRKRGGHFINGQGEKGDALEDKIYEYVEKNYDKVIRPVTAFVLFETQEGQ